MAEALDVPAHGVTIQAGAHSRDELIDVTDAPADLPARLQRLLDA